jgi:aspartyl-tRNA(Asn)/glutamyl-tRNA(Gln) amidotransferase subunit A
MSPLDALASVWRRMEEVNPALNAVVTHDYQSALQAATASNQRWQQGRPLSALDGVPFTVKDNIPVAGMRSTFGSRLYADHVPLRDELPVARLRAAGAVLLGKTNTPEFALQGYTDNALFGVTRNPWDLSLTPGGSSGGAVAAVAAGIGPIALATDGGGSIRRPCAHTACTGFKPSAGRVPRSDGFPAFLHDFEVVGPIAPFSALDSRSGSWRHQDFSVLVASPSRILLLTALGLAPVDAETRTSTEGAARVLESLGHQIETEVPEGLTALICAVNDLAWPVISQSGLAWFLGTHFSSRVGEISPALMQLLQAGRQHSGASYAHALDLVQRLRNSLSVLFERIDFLLLPAAAALPWAADQSHPPVIDGMVVGPRGHAVFTAFVNAAGLPALALPAKPSALGLPIGVQLVGGQGDDARLCSVGLQYQQAAPWQPLWQSQPKRPLPSILQTTGMHFA